MNISFSLLLPRDEASVPVVRRICGSALRDLGVEDHCVDDVQLALTEACTNVLKHAEGATDDYEVTVEVDERSSIIRVLDTGAGFDPENVSRDLPQDVAEGGRGIQLMQALVDHVDFVSRPEVGTIVHLEKNLDCNADSVLRKIGDRTTVAR